MRNLSRTAKTAELMLSTGKHYTAEILAADTGMATNQASGVLFNIRNTPRYEIESTELPGRTTRVISISKRKVSLEVAELKKQNLWRLAHGFAQREGD